MYIIMREAGEEKAFFNKIRVFSAVGTSTVFQVRVHRPIRLEESDFIQPGYPLGFGFDTVTKVDPETEGSRSRIYTIVHNITFKYGVDILHPILKDAVDKVVKNDSKPQPFYQNSAEKRPAQDSSVFFCKQHYKEEA